MKAGKWVESIGKTDGGATQRRAVQPNAIERMHPADLDTRFFRPRLLDGGTLPDGTKREKTALWTFKHIITLLILSLWDFTILID